MPFYVINLDRSVERWARIEAAAAAHSLRVRRVPAVDGKAVPSSEWRGVDHRRHYLWHGRRILPGEYGCYRSHLRALETFLESGEPVGLICEDDIVPDERTERIVGEVLAERPGLDMLKLANHRVTGFVRHGGREASEFGRCIHGPQGSAACYAVTRKGAERLLAGLSTMWLPYDVALERGWAYGGEIYTLRRDAVAFQDLTFQSTIVDPSVPAGYKRTKAPLPLRTPTAFFRAADYVRRALYSRR